MCTASMRKFSLVSVLVFAQLCLLVHCQQPYYIQQCHRSDPNVDVCLKASANKFARYVQKGIPELEIAEVEPVLIDEIGIVLGSGPDGYRATFKNLEAFGVSNLTISNIRSDIETLQFQMTFEIPRIKVRAQYESSGVLILVQASGSGQYWGEYEGVKAKVYFKASPQPTEDGFTFMNIESVKMDFSVRDIKMGVDNIANGNSIIQAALNLFINSNAQELLKEMKPTIRAKLVTVLTNFMDNLFERIPLDYWLTD